VLTNECFAGKPPPMLTSARGYAAHTMHYGQQQVYSAREERVQLSADGE
jgi:hypothetical protein